MSRSMVNTCIGVPKDATLCVALILCWIKYSQHILSIIKNVDYSRIIKISRQISEISYRHTTLFIVIDLSTPAEIWFTLETLLEAAKSRIENILAEMKQEDPGLRDRLKKKAWERAGGDDHVVWNK